MDYILALIHIWAKVTFYLAIEDNRAGSRAPSQLVFVVISARNMYRLAAELIASGNGALLFRKATLKNADAGLEWAPRQLTKVLGTLKRAGAEIVPAYRPYRNPATGKIWTWQEIEVWAVELANARHTGQDYKRYSNTQGYTPDGVRGKGDYIEVKSSNNGRFYK